MRAFGFALDETNTDRSDQSILMVYMQETLRPLLASKPAPGHNNSRILIQRPA